ncbi:hypothetical protein Tco_1184086 [Tanacetum coccineum]
MADFVPGRVVIDAAQRKHGKYMAKCVAIGYGFLPFSFSSLRELEADAFALLKRIRKFSMAQDIGARAAVHIFNMISFVIAKGNAWMCGKKHALNVDIQNEDALNRRRRSRELFRKVLEREEILALEAEFEGLNNVEGRCLRSLLQNIVDCTCSWLETYLLKNFVSIGCLDIVVANATDAASEGSL